MEISTRTLQCLFICISLLLSSSASHVVTLNASYAEAMNDGFSRSAHPLFDCTPGSCTAPCEGCCQSFITIDACDGCVQELCMYDLPPAPRSSCSTPADGTCLDIVCGRCCGIEDGADCLACRERPDCPESCGMDLPLAGCALYGINGILFCFAGSARPHLETPHNI